LARSLTLEVASNEALFKADFDLVNDAISSLSAAIHSSYYSFLTYLLAANSSKTTFA